MKPGQVLDRLRALRRQHLGSEIAAAWFGAQETQERYGLQLAALAWDQQVTALRAQGALEAQGHRLREQQLGTEGARSIGAMEAQKTDWERRRQAFVRHRGQIAGMHLSAQQEQEWLEALLRTLYSEEALPAARAYHQRQAD